MTWARDDIEKIATTDDLHIAQFREDGRTHGTPTWVWSVVVDGELYVRAYNGRNSGWYKAAVKQRAGRITAAGMAWDVAIEPVDGPIGGRIDDAYRAKYAGSSYLGSMVSERARAATIRIAPRRDIEKD